MVPRKKQEKWGRKGEPGKRKDSSHTIQITAKQGNEQAKMIQTFCIYTKTDKCMPTSSWKTHSYTRTALYCQKEHLICCLHDTQAKAGFYLSTETSDRLMTNCIHNTKYHMSTHLLLFAQYLHCKLLKTIFYLVFVQLKTMDFRICN